MALRDDRRGRRATVLTNGSILSPRFETGEALRPESTGKASSIGEALKKWLRRIISPSADDSTLPTDPSDTSFEDRLSTELATSEETQQCAALVDLTSDPPDDAFEVSTEIAVERERIVPITRRRLRSVPTGDPDHDRLGRLRALLRSGSDAERASVIDAFIGNGMHEELLPALNDRLDVLAAKAALGLNRSTCRADLIAAIKPHVSEGRLGAILTLLAGLRE